MSKMEERMEKLLDSRDQKLYTSLSDKMVGIFIWGFLCGALFSYTSLLPCFIGIILGICVTKKYSFCVNYCICQFEKLFKF